MKRTTKQIELGSQKAKFTIDDYISGLGNKGSGTGWRQASIDSKEASFAQPVEHFEDMLVAFNDFCDTERGVELQASTAIGSQIPTTVLARAARAKYGFFLSHQLHEVVDGVLSAMPYLRVLPYFRQNLGKAVLADSWLSRLVTGGVSDVCFIHKGDDYPCGVVYKKQLAQEYILFCPLTCSKRDGLHYTENPDRLVSLCRKYFKYRVPAKIAPYVAFTRAANSDLENSAKENASELSKQFSKVSTYGGDPDTSKEVYTLLRTMHNDGHVFNEGKLNAIFDDIAQRRELDNEYRDLSQCIMYAKMRSDGSVDFSFYYKDGLKTNSSYGKVRSSAFVYSSANYDLCSPMLNKSMGEMPESFVVPISQLALEEAGVFVDKVGLRLNNYEYVVYAEGAAQLLNPDGLGVVQEGD